jgi:hypothetical protein
MGMLHGITVLTKPTFAEVAAATPSINDAVKLVFHTGYAVILGLGASISKLEE